MPVPPPVCPGCGTPNPPGARVCPHCGAARLAAHAWPPAPVGFVPPAPPPDSGLVTGSERGDVLLGLWASAALSYAALALSSGFLSLLPAGRGWLLGLLVTPALYLTLRPRFRALARGLGFGVLTGCVVLPVLAVFALVVLGLGVLSLCSGNGH